jgi:predicted permease
MMWLAGTLLALVPDVGLPIATNTQLDARIFAFTALMCLAAALVSGAAPSLFLLRSDVNEALKEGGRAGTPSARTHRMRGALVIAEVALATVALIGAGLFVKSLRRSQSIHPGFDSSNVLFARFFIESATMSGDQIQHFALRLRRRLESVGGVQAVSYADFVPLTVTAGPYNSVGIEGYVPAEGETMNVCRSMVAPGYFAALRVPLLEGRDFTELDGKGAAPVAIVNETFARRYFPGGSPVGRRFRSMGRWFTVAGLVRDGKYFHPAEAARAFFFVPFQQIYSGSPELYFFIRTPRQPVEAIAALRRAVAEVDPRAAAFHPIPLSEYTQVALLGQKIAASLMGALGLLCLVLAALGLYSVMSYAISQRVHEFGIRMAVGAQPRDVVALVLRQGMTLALAGLALGVVAAIGAGRLVASMLVQVDAADPATIGEAALFLGAVALAASWLPARRATRLDPMSALRRH